MKRSKRLKPICDFAADKEQQAAKQLGDCKCQLDEQRQRLTDLENYHREYAQKLTTTGSGFSISQYQNMQAFMMNLNKAIEQQKQMIERLNGDYESKKKRWLDARNRGKALNRVADKYKTQEDQTQERKVQREIDDRAGRPASGKD